MKPMLESAQRRKKKKNTRKTSKTRNILRGVKWNRIRSFKGVEKMCGKQRRVSMYDETVVPPKRK